MGTTPMDELPVLQRVALAMADMPVRALVTKYRAEFEQHAALGRCPFRPDEPKRATA